MCPLLAKYRALTFSRDNKNAILKAKYNLIFKDILQKTGLNYLIKYLERISYKCSIVVYSKAK